MRNDKEIIKFLKRPESSEEGYHSLLQLFSYSFYKFDVIKNNYECDAVFHDFLLKNIFHNKTFFLFLHSSDEKDIMPYLKKMIRNFLINLRNKTIRKGTDLSLDETLNDDSNDTFADMLKNERVSHELIFEAKSILSIFLNTLTEKNKRILCQYLYSKEYQFISGINRDAFDKAVERIKKKVREIVEQNKLSFDSIKVFFDYIYVSEVCDKMRLDNGDTDEK
ncbi:hypothetical protein Flexsi_1351 [Flexistipes sinusarabici DSM 4947]|uniref:Uncharacterized protein n=1 Tax=Flexistipes sinusarabici (strain ATCC 49648 / DSM 4947 / MAS 10) TaxID=717231 RepID=F8E7T3_FLESM|nr:hypothetical protein [Flexistipes sinusarabici]AEI15001.1 hypothetical protein Flexsi_1351 [Flexistipes sinusarabici DSM 4947]